jgi:uncharacterized protein (DUF433 family)
MKRKRVIKVDPDIMGGKPVFTGTRVPVKTLFEHLESGCSLNQFLRWFPTVSRDAALNVLAEAEKLLLARAK